MEVSVIIPTFNNAAMLATTLTAFDRVEFPKGTELIVVDNNSTDATAEIIKSFSGQLPIRYVFEQKQGISDAKNSGIRVAKGKLIVFTDDDVRPSSQWLLTFYSAYQHDPDGKFWGGMIESEFVGPFPDKSLLRFAPPSVKGLNLGDKIREIKNNEWFVSANLAMPSRALAKVGGFNTGLGLNPATGIVLSGEESDLQRRLRLAGYCPIYLPTASLRHVVPAQKCTIDHIAGRAEATGRYMRSISPAVQGAKTFGGVPLWRYRKCFERRIMAFVKRIVGMDWYPDYISYRSDLGFIKGLPDGHCDGDK